MPNKRAAEQVKPELPGNAEIQLGYWSQAIEGGRSDDALIYLTDVSGKQRLGTLTLGWLREHTTFRLWEEAIISNRTEAARGSKDGF